MDPTTPASGGDPAAMPDCYTVTAEFKTPLRHCRPGDILTAADLDGALTITDWHRLGFVAPIVAPDPAPVAAPVPLDDPEV